MPAIDILARDGILTPDKVKEIKEKYPDTNFWSSANKQNRDAIQIRRDWIQQRYKMLKATTGKSSDDCKNQIVQELRERGENITYSTVEKEIY